MKTIIATPVAALLLLMTASSLPAARSLKGNWKYIGGIYNGVKDGEPQDYALQRRYGDAKFDAFLLEKGAKPQKYEAGNYRIKGDTCIETQTYSSEPSKLMNIPVHYLFEMRNDSLILNGTLPTGMVVEEYWKRTR